MTVYDFRMLSDCEQIDLLYKEGVYIGKRPHPGSQILLYQLDAFYVEVYYQKYRCLIKRLHCFTSTTLLNPYLEQMNVGELVRC